jgi:hypothetical protein
MARTVMRRYCAKLVVGLKLALQERTTTSQYATAERNMSQTLYLLSHLHLEQHVYVKAQHT